MSLSAKPSANLPLHPPTMGNLDELSRQSRFGRIDQVASSHCSIVLLLRQSRWPVCGFVDALDLTNANASQNPRTRLNTIKPRRLTRTGTTPSARRLRLHIFMFDLRELTTDAMYYPRTESRSPRPSDIPLSRAQIPNSEETTSTLYTER